MTIAKPRVCVIELTTSHDNDAFAQVDLLHEHFEVHVIAPPKLLAMDLFRATVSLYRSLPLTEMSSTNRWVRLALLPHALWRACRYCDRIGAEAIVFNTTYTWADLLLIVALFPRRKTFQIVHNYQRFLGPVSFLFFQWFSNNLVLSEEVYEHIRATHPKTNGKLSFFLPIFFKSFMDTCPSRRPKWKNGSAEFNLGVVGNIDQSRRNYKGLIEAVERLKAIRPALNFRIHMVGSAPVEFHALVREKGLEDVVSVYGFCSFVDMFALSESMDLVFFLIDSDVENYQYYNKYKVSGTSVLLKTFRRIGVSSDDFQVDRTLKETMLYYRSTDVGSVLEKLVRGEITHAQIAELERRYASIDLLSYNTQRRQLITALNLDRFVPEEMRRNG
jgi:glycosyltransferase involved in cell wall biosynthesis